MPVKPSSAHETTLRTRFTEKYGAAYRAGFIGREIADGLLRGLAFDLIASQDESVSLDVVVRRVEAAVASLSEWLDDHHPLLRRELPR